MVALSNESARGSGKRWRIWLAAYVVMVPLILSNAPTPLYVHWQREFDLSPSILSALFAAYVVGLLGSLSVAGQLSDQFGPRAVLGPGLSASLIACAVFLFADSAAELLFARFASGVGVGAATTAGISQVLALGGSARRRQAALLASSAVTLGAALGPILSGILAETVSWHGLSIFTIEGAVILVAVLAIIVLPRTMPKARAVISLRPAFAVIAQVPRIWVAIYTFGTILAATAFILSLGPSLLVQLTGAHSPLVAGAMGGLLFAAGVMAQAPVRHLSLRWLFLASIAVLLLGMIAIVSAVLMKALAPILVAAILAGCAYGLAQLAGVTLIAQDVPTGRQAEASALLNIGGYVPCGLSPVLAGLIADRTGLETATLILAGIVVVSAVGTAILVLRVIAR